MMLTQNGKLLYISDNAAEYLGHSMVSLRFDTVRWDLGSASFNNTSITWNMLIEMPI